MAVSTSVLLNRLAARAKFRHVQVLLRVAELGSVQRAADAIGLTQSSVTQTLAYLEALVEARLFHRHARGVTPTPACQDLLPVARQMMSGLADVAERLQAHQEQGVGTVRLLASLSALNGILLQALPGFHERHPRVQVHLSQAEGEDQLLAVARGEVDLVACRQPVAIPQGWQFTALQQDAFVVVCAPNHPVLKRRRTDWKTLAQAVWMQAPAETVARLRFEEFAQHFETPPRMHPLVSRMHPVALHLVQQEGVLALLPRSYVRHALDTGQLVTVPAPTQMLAINPMGLLRPMKPSGAAALLAEHLSGHTT